MSTEDPLFNHDFVIYRILESRISLVFFSQKCLDSVGRHFEKVGSMGFFILAADAVLK